MGNPGIHPEHHAFCGRMQKESCATATTATSSGAGSNGFAIGQSEFG
jgi:hypothetical protein